MKKRQGKALTFFKVIGDISLNFILNNIWMSISSDTVTVKWRDINNS